MRTLRWVLTALLGLYALAAAAPVAMTLAYKAGLYTPAAPTMRALMAATPAAVLVLWVAVIALYTVAAVQLARRRRALAPLLLALIGDVAVVLLMQGTDAYQAAFSVAQQQVTWALLAAMLVIVLPVWGLERNRRRTNPTPRSPVALT